MSSSNAATVLLEPEKEAAQEPEQKRLKWHVQSFGLTHPGKVRPANEDQFLVARLTKSLHVEHTSLPQTRIRHGSDQSYLFLVADGMGGHAAGEKASALVVDSIEEFVLNTFKWFFR